MTPVRRLLLSLSWLAGFFFLVLRVQSQGELLLGYALIRIDPDRPAPVATALFSFRNGDGTLVSEAGVAASRSIRRGRVFVDQRGTGTGIALANPASHAVPFQLILREQGGREIERKPLVLAGGERMSRLVSDPQLFPGTPQDFIGSLTFETSNPSHQLAAVTLRVSQNSRREPIFATLPVIDLDVGMPEAALLDPRSVVFPHVGAGPAGLISLSTQIILLNPGEQQLSGSIRFIAPDGTPLPVQIEGETASEFPFQLAPHGVLERTVTNSQVVRGYAVVTVDQGETRPAGTAIFQYRTRSGELISEAGVGAVAGTTRARVFVDTVATRTGLAIANPGVAASTIELDLLDRNGFPLQTSSVTIAPNGQVAFFVGSEFGELTASFTGLLEIRSQLEVVPVTLRFTRNNRGAPILTTLPVADLTLPNDASELVFPHIGFGPIAGGEFATRIILINPDPARLSSGLISFISNDGSALVVPLSGIEDSGFDFELIEGGGRQVRPGNRARAATVIMPSGLASGEIAVNRGNTVSVTPQVVDSDGQIRDDLPFEFASVDPEVASVDAFGRITGRRLGFATLTITSGSAIAAGVVNVAGVSMGAAAFDVTGIVQDQASRLYLADTGNHAILLAESVEQLPEVYAGVVAMPGFRDDLRLNAQFSTPAFLALNQGNASLYVSDSDNHVIRQVVPGTAGAVETLAGVPGEPGIDDGSLETARFREPQGILLDGRGHLWVVDTGNHTVRRIDLAAGLVETAAGMGGQQGLADGRGEQARFSSPVGIAMEPEPLEEQLLRELRGDPPPPTQVIVTDTGNGLLRRIRCPQEGSCAGRGEVDTIRESVSIPAKPRSSIQGLASGLTAPTGIAVDPTGVIYVSEPFLGEVRGVLPDGRVVPSAQEGSFANPGGIAVGRAGKLLVAERGVTAAEVTYGAPEIDSVNPGEVPFEGGVVVTLNGRNFPPETRVVISGVAITQVDIMDTRTIRFLVPPLPSGRGTLTVQTRGGFAQTSILTRAFPADQLAPGSITTFAGGSLFRGDGAFAVDAVLAIPTSLTVDPEGNLLIVDRNNNRIRSVDPVAGIITSIAGSGLRGYLGDGGPAIQAALDFPASLAVDPAGDLYIAEAFNHVIRRVDAATGFITTVAGTGVSGASGDGGLATESSLRSPRGVALDRENNLFIADTGSHRIRRVDANSGIMTTVAGNGDRDSYGDEGPATEAALKTPFGLTIDAGGNIWIADTRNHAIRRVDAASGIIQTFAGTGVAGFSGHGEPARESLLNFPAGVAFDPEGDLLIADAFNHMIRRVDAGGNLQLVAGTGVPGFSGDGGAATEAVLNVPEAVSVNGAGELLIADSFNSRIRRVDSLTGTITTIAGAGNQSFSGDGDPAEAAALMWPEALVLDGSSDLLIADRVNGRIRRVDAVTGVITTVAGNGDLNYYGDGEAATEAALFGPSGLALDTDGNLWISDTGNDVIRRVAADTGIIQTVAGTGEPGYSGDEGPASAAALNAPFGLALRPDGKLLIADRYNHVIRQLDIADGTIDTLVGTGVRGISEDGTPARDASLAQPTDVAIDSIGNMLIADSGNHRVVRLDSDSGLVDTIAGTGDFGYSGDGGLATQAELGRPRRIALDSTGNILISDTFNDVVRRVDVTTGMIETVAGTALRGFSGDGGPATEANLAAPSGIVVDREGNLYISDLLNGRVRFVRADSQKVSVK